MQIKLTKKVCFVIGGLAGGGQERAMTTYANAFAKDGVDVFVICLFKTEIFFELDSRIQIFWPNLDRNNINKFIYAFKLIPYIRSSVKKSKASSVVSFGDWINSYTIISTLFLKKKVVIMNRMGPNLYLGRFIETLNRLTYPLADTLIVQTKTAAEILNHKYKINNIKILPNPVVKNEKYQAFGKKGILSIGRLSKEKGHEVLIRAYSLIETSWPLHLIGDGPERSNLEKLISELNIESKVHFHGHLKDFQKVIADCSIFVLPSKYEGFPNALLEAMVVPLACISSNCIAGPSEIISNGQNGLLFEPLNIDDLSMKLKTLIDSDDLRAQFNKESLKVIDNYDLNKITNTFSSFIFQE